MSAYTFVLVHGAWHDESPSLYREPVLGTVVDGTFSLPWPLWREAFLDGTDEATAKRAMPPGAFAWFPRFFERSGLCRLVQMPGSHEALFSNPVLVAEKLVEAGRDCVPEP